jgi:phage virion morphogenesis protein
MAGASFELELSGDVAGRLERLATVVYDLAPLLDEMGAAMVSGTQRRFELGQAPDGSPWLPSRRASEQGGQTLIKDGHLRDSITHNVDGDTVVVGSDRIYAAIHQFGGEIKPKSGKFLVFQAGAGMVFARKVDIPSRPFLGLSSTDEEILLGIAEDYLAQAVNEVSA